MKKPVIAALCCLLALGTATVAFAEEPTPTPAPELVELSPEETAPQFYPDSISWQEDGGQLLVVKQYSVPYGTAVTDLTESGMQWGGADYTLWGVTESVEGGVTEEKEVTQDFELSVRSADAETARNDVKESVAYDDEYGFSGSLTLQDITIGETLQADSTYMATAHYAGTVTRTEAGTVHYTLLYAPVSVPAVVAAAESGITPALLIMGIACALLFIAVLLIITHLLHKEPVHATEPAKSAPAPKVYVPSGDIVLGGRNEDDDKPVGADVQGFRVIIYADLCIIVLIEVSCRAFNLLLDVAGGFFLFMLLAINQQQNIVEQRCDIVLVPIAAQLQLLNDFTEQRFVVRQHPAVEYMLIKRDTVICQYVFLHHCL